MTDTEFYDPTAPTEEAPLEPEPPEPDDPLADVKNDEVPVDD